MSFTAHSGTGDDVTTPQAPKIETVQAWRVDAEPGNATSYNLHLTSDARGGLIVAWLDGRFVGRLYQPDGYWAIQMGRLNKADDVAIRGVLHTLSNTIGERW